MQGKPRFWGREQAADGRRGEPCEAEELGERRSVKGLGGWGSVKGLSHGAFHASSAALGAFFGSPKGRKGPGGEFFWLFFSEKRRKGPVSSLILSDRLMLSGFFHRNNASELRQRCREWFLASRHGLLSYALRHADGMTDVELLLAEVMRRVAEAIASGRVPIEAIAPYTLRCLRNGAVELRRKNARRLEAERRFTEAEAVQTQADEAAASDGLEDRHVYVRRLLRRLPPELAAVVTLRLWDELTFAEIARRLELPETSVRRRYDKGLQVLKSILNRS